MLGCAVGPVPPEDVSVKNDFKGLVEIKNIIPISKYRFVIAEVNSPEDLKKMTKCQIQHGDYQLCISVVDVKRYKELVDQLSPIIPQCVENDNLNFSTFTTRFHVKLEYPKNCSFLLFLASMYTKLKNISIKSIDLSGNNLNNTNPIYWNNIRQLFPDLTQINFKNNKFSNPEEMLLDGINIEIDTPRKDAKSISQTKSQSAPKDNPNIPPCPNFIAEHIPPPKILLKDVPITHLYDNEFPVAHFITNFFKCSWQSIQRCAAYYSPEARLTIRFSDNTTREAKGAADILKTLLEVFPNGFHAHPNRFMFSELDRGFYGLVAHGGFEAQDGNVYAFDRSFFVAKVPGSEMILNDILVISDYN